MMMMQYTVQPILRNLRKFSCKIKCRELFAKGGMHRLQRFKWTDKMVRLLITAVSYIREESNSRRGIEIVLDKDKWKSISKVMAERGYHVSSEQCRDMFERLHKRYKKLNDILGPGTSCAVVENPALLDVIDFLTEEQKQEAAKILSKTQLYYQEMCSYHNGNRLHLPHDLALQRSLQFALYHDTEYQGSQQKLIKVRSLQLENQKMEIQAKMLELEKEKFKWQRFSKKRNRELENMMIENQRIKLENERLALLLR